MRFKAAGTGAAFVALIATVAIAHSSIRNEERKSSLVAQQHVAPIAQDHMDGKEKSLTVTAVEGTLSDFWGRTTQYTGDIWVVEGASGITVVIASDDMLTAYFGDDRAPAFAIVEGGKPSEFMDLLAACASSNVAGEETCGTCTTQDCCNLHCTVYSQWCVCTANATCGERGVCQLHIGAQSCDFTCCDP